MLIKIVGSLLIISASTIIGCAYSRDYARRPAQLRELQGQLQILENELSFQLNPLLEAFSTIAGTGSITTNFFSSAARYLKNKRGISATRAWELAINDNISATSLVEEDKDIIIAFGKMLGSSDLEGQIRNIRLTLSQLEIQESKAEESRKKNESMYRNLGVLGGLALVIFLV